MIHSRDQFLIFESSKKGGLGEQARARSREGRISVAIHDRRSIDKIAIMVQRVPE